MDGREFTQRSNADQCAPRVYQRRDGGFVVAHDEDGVTWLGTLVVVPNRTALDRFKDALCRERAEFQDDLAAGAAGDAFALSDARVDAAFEALREALKS